MYEGNEWNKKVANCKPSLKSLSRFRSPINLLSNQVPFSCVHIVNQNNNLLSVLIVCLSFCLPHPIVFLYCCFDVVVFRVSLLRLPIFKAFIFFFFVYFFNSTGCVRSSLLKQIIYIVEKTGLGIKSRDLTKDESLSARYIHYRGGKQKKHQLSSQNRKAMKNINFGHFSNNNNINR